MRIAKLKVATLATTVILVAIISLHSAISLMMESYTITSSGLIGISVTRPLHTEGKYIKDDLGQVVYLRGVWKGCFADTCIGWFTPPGMDISSLEGYVTWDESYVTAHLQVMRDHGFNSFGTFIWADWWLQDASTSIAGYETDLSYRTALRETIRLAQAYGIYVQVRVYGITHTDHVVGRIPFPPYATFPGIIENQDDFVNLWASIAEELGGYPNVYFCLYDEPCGFPDDRLVYFDVAGRCINAIRTAGFDGLIMPMWCYCGDCYWMEQWINEGNPTHNIVFSNHIYRYHGTFDGIGRSTDLDAIRDYMLADTDGISYPPLGLHYNRIVNELNMPVIVHGGAFLGATDDAEYTCFKNVLTVCNELEIGYYGFAWHRSDMAWALQEHTVAIQPLNRVGQALKDAIAAGTP